MLRKSHRGTATSAIWKMTYRAWVITFAPIPQARDQLLSQRGKRPVADTLWQSQTAQVVRQGEELKARTLKATNLRFRVDWRMS